MAGSKADDQHADRRWGGRRGRSRRRGGRAGRRSRGCRRPGAAPSLWWSCEPAPVPWCSTRLRRRTSELGDETTPPPTVEVGVAVAMRPRHDVGLAGARPGAVGPGRRGCGRGRDLDPDPDPDPDPDAEPGLGFDNAPGVVVEPELGRTAAADAVGYEGMPRSAWGGNLGRDPPGASTTSTASRTATPARPASMPRRWEPGAWGISSNGAADAVGPAPSPRVWSNSWPIKNAASGSGPSPPDVTSSSSMSHPFLERRPARRSPQRRTDGRPEACGPPDLPSDLGYPVGGSNRPTWARRAGWRGWRSRSAVGARSRRPRSPRCTARWTTSSARAPAPPRAARPRLRAPRRPARCAR